MPETPPSFGNATRATPSTTTNSSTVEKTITVDLSLETLDQATSRVINADPNFIDNQIVSKKKSDGSRWGTITYQAKASTTTNASTVKKTITVDLSLEPLDQSTSGVINTDPNFIDNQIA
ncbi:hypothetical protein B9479_005898 [Cryptococcus floricola]|uniref:Uncharacterized protein n=1 Tax=Cryptococcus floricola TaxID=2591691 RepID=A0A5D3ARV4_9TREE|nr:hypothetical protein B9479_005898 [Cryptococcus floricola]